MAKIVNITGHPVRMVTLDGDVISFPKRGGARIPQRRAGTNPVYDSESGQHVDAVKILSTGTVKNIPPPKEGVLYIVSRIVFMALPKRKDLLVPDGAQRDDRGNVIAARRFIRRM